MRAGLTAACAIALLLAGCAGPNPVQSRVALLCWYAPRVTVHVLSAATNAPAASAPRAEAPGNALSAAVSQRGVCVIVDNMFSFPVGSGQAHSNSALSGLSFPLTP